MDVKPSLLHRLFYPQIPLLMSAVADDRISSMPVVSYSAVSVSPPLVLVGCGRKSTTYLLAKKARAFSLSVLPMNGKNVAAIEKLATTSGRDVEDKLKAAGLPYAYGRAVRVPVIRGADATLECVVKKTESLGDHAIVVGLVRAAYTSDKFEDNWDFKRYRPILYTGWEDGLTTLEG